MERSDIGARIVAARRLAGLTQPQLGLLVGYSDQTIARWEKGISVPRPETLALIEEKLGLGPDWFSSERLSRDQVRKAAERLVRQIELVLRDAAESDEGR